MVEGVAWDCRTTPGPLNFLFGAAVRQIDPPISTPNPTASKRLGDSSGDVGHLGLTRT